MNISIADGLHALWPRANPALVNGMIVGQEEAYAKFGILDDRLAILHFMAQVSAETDGGVITHESLYYTHAQRLREVWPKRFRDKSDVELAPLLRNPDGLAESVYEGRMGNDSPGDGSRYAGKGLLQTTGKSAYRQLGDIVGLDLVHNPEQIVDPQHALLCAVGDFISVCGCLKDARADNLAHVSALVNVGHYVPVEEINGWANRVVWYNRWNRVL